MDNLIGSTWDHILCPFILLAVVALTHANGKASRALIEKIAVMAEKMVEKMAGIKPGEEGKPPEPPK